jgi:hypothetical protein
MRDARPVPTSSRPVPGTGKPDRFPVPSYREPEPGTGRGNNSRETLGNQSGNRSGRPAATPGLAYWRARLAPLVQRGFTRGLLDPLEVTLVNEVDGTEFRLPRPSAAWVAASLLLPPLDDDLDPDDPVRRGIVYSMRAPSGDRMELSV